MLKINNMDKIKNSATMNKSAENPATTHTHNRYRKLLAEREVEYGNKRCALGIIANYSGTY